jgi:3-deoxy-D-manno-octulosonate 8-phosphate phosphatase (KDO 8-P phosphatase)
MNKQIPADEVLARAKKIKLLLMDCDGVLTDGRLYYNESGEAMKIFHVRDGQGIVSWHQAGFRSGIISGRSLDLVKVRARELGIEFVRQKSENKLADFQTILASAQVAPEETAFIGDDIADIILMKNVGLAVAVADAMQETKEAAHFITLLNGGHGAVREVTDLILRARGQLNGH